MSFIIQPSAAGNVFAGIASGAIAANKPCLVNSDGTVSELGIAVGDQGSVTGGVDATTLNYRYGVDLGNNRVALLGYQGSNVYVVIATLSGTNNTTITFSAAQQVSATTVVNDAIMAYDSANSKLIIAYGTNSVPWTQIQVVIGTVSGTSISFGTPVNANPNVPFGGIQSIDLCFDPTANRAVLMWFWSGDNNHYYQMGTISGTSISFSSTGVAMGVTYNASGQRSVYHLGSSTIVTSGTNYGTATGTIRTYSNNGTTLTLQGSVSLGTVGGNALPDVAPAPGVGTTALVLGYLNSSNYPIARPFTITASGATITLGTALVVNSVASTMFYPSASNSSAFAIWFGTGYTGGNCFGIGSKTLSTTTVTFNTPVPIVAPFGPDNAQQNVFSQSAGVAVLSVGGGGGFSYRCIAGNFKGSNIAAQGYIGYSTGAAANGASVTVETIGAQADGLSGLTPGLFYYLRSDGSLNTTAGTPSVYAGIALKTDTLLIKG